jgi:hypothetical protein
MTSPNPFGELPALPNPLAGSGYDWMGQLANAWHVVSAWGQDGWNLGNWPYVVVAHYDHPGGAAMALLLRDGFVGDGSGVAAGDAGWVCGRVRRGRSRDRAWTWWCPRPGWWPWAPGSGRRVSCG